ncbi:multiple sugar transport system permease protein [Paenibacillus shirakamiensis]|uniref:Multiple sugar transport system permease protein n=1 Tax=Paenibacillus shirakamiensis TaxID=1265935 RepID=A0ABS4JMU6_9BACL|nr:carbohydrate ABC transporter permease [Paenibacillus shirakamiensis]MBP2001929.1 multiple sugar transport system permease protein [Paenibacillus shirakamiensis]
MAAKRIEKTVMIVLLIVVGVLMMIPFIWMLGSSFKPESEFTAIPPTVFPKAPTLEHYKKLFVEMNFLIYLKNTLVIVIWSFVGLFLNAIAGYAFAKFEFPGKNKFFYIILATMMIPSQVTMIPTYLIINEMGLTNTMAGIVLPSLVGAFGIFLFRQFMTTIPDDLMEAARLDGAGELLIFFRLILPIVKPVFAVQGILTFIGAWNSFLWPLIIANDESLYTLSVGLSLLKGQYGTNFGLQMAGAAFMVVPIIIIFTFFQKHIIEGYTISGMK